MEQLKVVSCPTTELSRTNKAVLNPADRFAQIDHIIIVKKNETFIFSTIADVNVPPHKIAFNLTGRKWAGLMLESEVTVGAYEFVLDKQCLNTITFTTDFASRQNAPVDLEFDTDEMSKQFAMQFNNQALTVGQLFAFVFSVGTRKVTFELKVKELRAISIGDSEASTNNVEIGLTTANTVVYFERAEGSDVKLIGGMTDSVAAPRIFAQNWDFGSMGIGGLSKEFNTMFIRAFASRMMPPKFAEKMGCSFVRGILLYGPPGTGKTLIARQIGKVLLAREPKVVNGPEVLNKYVGESEANIRKLFHEAEEEQAKLGVNSGLHLIIFDEIDALCKSRGSSPGSAGVGDNVVNQLLSMIDGVNALKNVLLIGMTNRKDLIDEALLRPGRFEVQIEIGLPSCEGRLEIFKIHTKKLLDSGVLDSSVDLEELAGLTRNYTGAEIAGVVEAARSKAVSEIIKPGKEFDQGMLDSIRVTREHLLGAIENDVKPAHGASEDTLNQLARPIIYWDPEIESILSQQQKILDWVARPDLSIVRPFYVLLLGGSGSGLTTLAANMALRTKFPFIRIYQARTTAGKTETAKVQYMEKLFNDASRSELSCIMVDKLEKILDYHQIGPRFSNTLLTVFFENRSLVLKKDHRMLVICTCHQERFLNDLSLTEGFDAIINVPSLTEPRQVDSVLSEMSEQGESAFSEPQRNDLMKHLSSLRFKIGIRRLELLAQRAIQDSPEDRVNEFIDRMHCLKLVDRPLRL